MSTKKDKLFQMRVEERFLLRLDNIRRAEPDIPSRTEMARRLIETAFEIAELRLAPSEVESGQALLKELQSLVAKGQSRRELQLSKTDAAPRERHHEKKGARQRRFA